MFRYRTKKISLRHGVDPTTVLGAARSALETKGYLWVPQDGDKAEAHEGGKEITRKSFTAKLRLGLEAGDDQLVLRNISHGAGFSNYGVTRIGLRMLSTTRAIKKALTEAELV